MNVEDQLPDGFWKFSVRGISFAALAERWSQLEKLNERWPRDHNLQAALQMSRFNVAVERARRIVWSENRP